MLIQKVSALSIRQNVRLARNAATDFLFPPSCHLCHRAFTARRQFSLCDDCLKEVDHSDEPRCPRCSAVIGPYAESLSGCVYCQTDSYAFRGVQSLGNYEGVLQAAILKGKIGGDVAILNSLTSLLIARHPEFFKQANFDLLLPIPHHWRDRLFAFAPASDIVAYDISRILKVPIDRHILFKQKRTPKQQSLVPSARRANLQNAFECSQHVHLDGAKILLVDDVLTTGTTCQRATRELLKAGAAEVSVAVLGRGVGAT